MAKKYILSGGAWKLASDDTLEAIKNLYNGKPVGSMLFGLPANIPLKALSDLQNSVAAIAQTDAEVTAAKAANQFASGFVIDTRGTIWSWNGTTWSSTTLTTTSLRTYLRPRRFYYAPITGVVWFVSSAMALSAFLKKDNPFATQANVTAGSGTGLISPATLKNAYGSW